MRYNSKTTSDYKINVRQKNGENKSLLDTKSFRDLSEWKWWIVLNTSAHCSYMYNVYYICFRNNILMNS